MLFSGFSWLQIDLSVVCADFVFVSFFKFLGFFFGFFGFYFAKMTCLWSARILFRLLATCLWSARILFFGAWSILLSLLKNLLLYFYLAKMTCLWSVPKTGFPDFIGLCVLWICFVFTLPK